MASNLFGRYVWLIDLLLQRPRTFEEIDRAWQRSGLGYGEPLPKRTFHNHCRAVEDIFGVVISSSPSDGYRYRIENPEQLEGDHLRNWLIDTYTVHNQLQADPSMRRCVLLEPIPSGHRWLTPILDAMRERMVLQMTHQGFERDEPSSFTLEPYALKMAARRWYLLARSPFYSEQKGENVFLTYALDRILSLEPTGVTFRRDEHFDAEAYFNGCLGVITTQEYPIELWIQAHNQGASYLRTLPLHPSQMDRGSGRFSYLVRPTYDLIQALLSLGDQVEVLQPAYLRKEMKELYEKMSKLYSNE